MGGVHAPLVGIMDRLTDRLAQETAQLKPDFVVTWGPDGG